MNSITNEQIPDKIRKYRLGKLYYDQLREGMRAILDPKGLSIMEADIILALFHNAGCDTISKLCADIGKTKGVVSVACEHLVKDGFISNSVDEKDRRIVHFRYLPAAKPVITELMRFTEVMDYVLALRSEEQKNHSVLGVIDLEKGTFFPVAPLEKTAERTSYPLSPSLKYSRYLERYCLKDIHPEDKDRFIKIATDAVQKQTPAPAEDITVEVLHKEDNTDYLPARFVFSATEGIRNTAILRMEAK